MTIAVIGTGYVGLVQAVCLAELGHAVCAIDIDETKIAALKQGTSPIYEPGLTELLVQNQHAGRLSFQSEIPPLKSYDVVFIAVGTPSAPDGSADLTYVLKAAADIGKALTRPIVVATKSTVPVGTSNLVHAAIAQSYTGTFSVLSNPEFLREGSAVADFMQPDRIIIGGPEEAAAVLQELYQPLDAPVFCTSSQTAELIKYASNSYLASQISFINGMARLCEAVGADVTEVAKGMKLDSRIGQKSFLEAGLGYGGSCFPKDVDATLHMARANNLNLRVIEATTQTNQEQRIWFLEKIMQALGSATGKTIAIWGVAFKPSTDDVRDAPSLDIARYLLEQGAQLQIFDPIAQESFQRALPDPRISYVTEPLAATDQADLLVILTEWPEFRSLKPQVAIIVDGRNIYTLDQAAELAARYISVGRPTLG